MRFHVFVVLLLFAFFYFWGEENIKLVGREWVLEELEERIEYDQNILCEKLKRPSVRRVRFNFICFHPSQLFHRVEHCRLGLNM